MKKSPLIGSKDYSGLVSSLIAIFVGLLFGFLFFAGYGCLFGGGFLLGLGGSVDLLIRNRSNRVSTGDTLFEGGEEILRIKGDRFGQVIKAGTGINGGGAAQMDDALFVFDFAVFRRRID